MTAYVNLSCSRCAHLDSSFLPYILSLVLLRSFPVNLTKVDPFPPPLLTAGPVSLFSFTHPNVTPSSLPFLAALLLLSLLPCNLQKIDLPYSPREDISTVSLLLTFLPRQASAPSTSTLLTVPIFTCFNPYLTVPECQFLVQPCRSHLQFSFYLCVRSMFRAKNLKIGSRCMRS